MLDFVGKRYWYILFSGVVIVAGIISLLISPGLNLGIDFSSGSTMTLVFGREISQAGLRDELTGLGHGEAIIQHTNKDALLVGAGPISEAERQRLEEALTKVFGPVSVLASSGQESSLTIVSAYPLDEANLAGQLAALGQGGARITKTSKDAFLVQTRTLDAQGKTELEAALKSKLGQVGLFDFYTVSPTVAGETVSYAFYAVAAAAVGIMLYITLAFRKVPKPFRFGICAVAALMHDVVVVVGLFSIMGKLWGLEVNAMFITGVLTVIGYSVHDKIVVFDRIRENIKKAIAPNFATTVNNSIMETLGRSINTSLTIVFTLLALLIFGGVTIRSFILVLFIGIIVGTYSSIFIASQLLVIWERGEIRRLFRRAPARPAAVEGGQPAPGR
jgi:preprotein translocase subunit SecF